MLPDFKVVGHRGFRSQFPENTIVSFLKAIDVGVDSIEFDVRLTKDRQLVITHDDTVDRCSNGTGKVCDFTFDEIRKLDFGSYLSPDFTGTQIPTLEETLDAIYSKKPNFYLLVELKENDDECTRRVYDICKKANLLDNGLILSFHRRQLELIRQWDPTAYLQSFPNRYVKDSTPDPENPFYNKICYWTREANNEEIDTAHRRGLTVDICPVDDEEQFNKAMSLNCDSITTNNPEIIFPLLKKHGLR